MQFITNGPDIPDALLQAHEEGRVVFFCGAGISYPARLPGFAGLVAQVYRDLSTTPNAVQQAAIKAGQFDTAIGLLEADIVGGRTTVRQALANILRPDLSTPNATATHEALVMLGKSRSGQTRLITTNFDRLFEEVIATKSLPIERFKAPLLPVPKNRWDGLVYLHGLLDVAPTASELERLVVSSGDFGLAYLTERWAARFVSELFRSYTVCFVGYSINDPVLRYMMDALAADRLKGESPPEMFAFGSFSKGKETERANEWRAKNVTPILYREHNRHAYLHRTLRAWAETYRDGATGRERIVVEHALARPSASTRHDDYVGRMLWALSDPSGLPAKRFAEFTPVPSLDWLLDAFSADRYGHANLARFNVPPSGKTDAEVRYSLVHRPAPYALAPPMRLVTGGIAATKWDPVMSHLAQWLVLHLNDPRLILWIAERGGQLHEQWIRQIERRLDELAQLERDGKTSDLDEIRAYAPNAIPGPPMQTLWRLLLSGRVKSPWREADLFRWKNRLKRGELTTTLRLELRDLLALKVRLHRPFRWFEEPESDDKPQSLRQLVGWELVLASDDVESTLHDLVDAKGQDALPALLDDVGLLLRDALDLLSELGDADQRSDRSHFDLPSISDHWQNGGLQAWVSLIELLRDAWLATREADSERATRVATAWFEFPYPTFKRLALFAASQDGSVVPEQWVEWLTTDGARWLWAPDTHREALRLLVLQGSRLTSGPRDRLESAILAGPPRELYPDDIEPDEWQRHVERSIWLRLAKLSSSGSSLGTAGAARLAELSSLHPEWKLAANQEDEFLRWMSGTDDPDYEEHRDVDRAPGDRRELAQWLAKPKPEGRPFYEDNWRRMCRTRFLHCLCALNDLASRDVWPARRWREALQVWSEGRMVSRSWRYASPIVQTMPDTVLRELDHGVTWWLKAASKPIDQHEDILLGMCQRVLDLPTDAEPGISEGDGATIQKPVTAAINHPIGHVTQALINVWFKREPNDDDGLPADIGPLFTQLCDVRVQLFRHGRVLLASRLIAFFRIDRQWTEQYLLPRFDWTVDPVEAKAAWEGFLWSPRLYQPLLLAFKPQFLETARHYEELGEHARQFAAFLTYAALGSIDGYATTEWRAAIGDLPQEGLQRSAQTLVQALEGAADQREEYWKHRIHPFLRNVWPKSREHATPNISGSLARLSIAAGSEFPTALAAVQAWLRPIEGPHSVIHCLHESGLSDRFPSQALRLLAAVVSDQPWYGPELGQCLDLILKSDGSLAQDPDYQNLREYFRKRG